VIDTRSRKGIGAVILNTGQVVEADCLAVSGGWSPNVHLTCHHRGRPEWREDIAGFVPGGELPPGMIVAGATNGAMTLAAALTEGHTRAAQAASDLGHTAATGNEPLAEDEAFATSAFWHVTDSKHRA